MRAVVLHEFGPPAGLVLDRLPDPVPGPGQALVEVELASVTFVETQVRAGLVVRMAVLYDLLTHGPVAVKSEEMLGVA